ncbi:MAG TPA: hypothetical protein VH252_06365, partial [Chthoniobacterales bacterium]|nr:hypothetical protein [Chthoniobacterales bacterium]
GAVAICLLLKREAQSRRFALLLLALGACSAVLFLLQIHRVNPEAWSDLSTAIRMRLDTGVQSGSSANVSSGEVRFGFWEWVQKVLQALDEDYLRVTWVLVLGGAIYLFRQRKSAGPRWLGWAALLMAAAGVPYLVILRNWSYVHDFASFFVIGSIAILGGLAIEAIWEWLERPSAPRSMRPVAAVLTALLLPTLAWAGFIRAEAQRSQFVMLEGADHEPPNLIRDLGRYLGTVFPADTTILCNFDPYYSPLSYYAQRDIRRNVITLDEWKSALETKNEVDGGVIWLDAPTAVKIRATLPAAEISETEIDGVRFAIWRRSVR